MEKIAEIGAGFAEEAYEEYKVKMNNVVTRKIPLIFYNTSIDFQQTNTAPGFIPEGVGGFFEFTKGRVVIPSTGSLHDFRHVIRHEITHVFMTNKIYRVLKDHREPADVLPPLWFVEGLAEYFSTEVDAQAEMVMRDAVINNYFVGIDDIWRIYGTFVMYKEGQSFLEFVEEKYGAEKIPLILENFWMYKSFNKVIEHTLEKSIEELDREWTYYLKQKYYPLFSDRVPQEIGAKKITDFGFNFSPVYFENKEQKFICFVANRDGYSSVYKLEIDDKFKAINDPEILLEGERSDEFESFHLFQSGIDISKDGLLALVSKSGATDVIHFLSVTEKHITKTFQRDYLISISSPKYSLNGNLIVFQAVDQKGFSDIYIYNILYDSLLRLTNDYYDDRDPSFSTNENEILFSSDRTAGEYEKKYNIFSYNLESNVIIYITYNNFNLYNPIISPDKNKLVMASDADGVRNIYKINITNNVYENKIEKVTQFITSAFDPAFANDSILVYTGFEKLSFHLYAANLNQIRDTTISYDINLADASGFWRAVDFASSSELQKLSYQQEYSLDFATGVVSTDPIFGTRGGAIFALSDVLGNDRFLFLIYNTATVQSEFLRSFNVAIQRVNLAKRVNYGYGVFHFSGNRYDITESDEFFYERSFGGSVFVSYPISKFQRIESTLTLLNSDREIVEGITARKSVLLGNSLAFIHDNSLWGPSGPLDGSRLLVLLGYTSDIKFSNVNYYSLIADYRSYLRLGYRSALAFRLGLFYNEGKEARRYFMGGSWDLRGWPRWSLRGEKMWISSLELRFPLIDEINIKFPFLNLGFWGLRGATYFDIGSAWDNEYTTTYGSLGFGFRFNLFGVFVLRYDIGKKIEDNFKRFQPGLFYQFFFGWDF